MRIGSQGPFSAPSVAHLYGGSYEKARVGIVQAERAGALRFVGDSQFNEMGGRRERLYVSAGLRVKADRVLHDAFMHKYVLPLAKARYRLAYDCDPALQADAEIWFSDNKFAYAEMDMETESLSTVLGRLSNYEPTAEQVAENPDPPATFMVLFLTLSQARVEKIKLRLHGRWIGRCILFGVWYDVIKDGRGGIWETFKGVRGRICPIGG